MVSMMAGPAAAAAGYGDTESIFIVGDNGIGGGNGSGGGGGRSRSANNSNNNSDTSGRLYTVIDWVLRAVDHESMYEVGSGVIHREKVRRTVRWVWFIGKLLLVLSLLYVSYEVLLRRAPSAYERMLSENNIVLLDARRASLKQYKSQLQAIADTQLRSECAPVTEAGFQEYTKSAVVSRHNLLIGNVLNVLHEKMRDNDALFFLAPKFYDYYHDTAMQQRIDDVVVNPCIVLFRSSNDSMYYDMIDPLVVRDNDIDRHDPLDTRPTYALSTSLIYGDIRNVERQRPAEIRLRYRSPTNGYRAVVIILSGIDVHRFMDGYELLRAEIPPQSATAASATDASLVLAIDSNQQQQQQQLLP